MGKTIVIAKISDTHSNSKLGLMPASGIRIDEGNWVSPNVAQVWMWMKWEEYWLWVKDLMREFDAPLWVVINGDAVDGTNHHGTSQVLTRSRTGMMRCAMACLGVPLQVGVDRWFVLRGTEAHDGKGGDWAEMLGERLGAEKDSATGSFSWWHLLMEVNGTLIDFQHHGKAGRINRTKGSSINLLAQDIMSWYAGRGERVPDLAIRSHVHVHADSYDNYPVRAITLPPWSFKNAFAYKVAPEVSLEVGGIASVLYPDGGKSVKKRLFKPRGPRIWREPMM